MIISNNSKLLLKYEKSKSKLVEFNVEKDNYPVFPLDSENLTYITIYILSRYCEELILNEDSNVILELKKELSFVSKYFDTTVKTKTRIEYNNELLLLGAISYFLSENFGSAKVLIGMISSFEEGNIVITILYKIFMYLLKGELFEILTDNQYYSSYLNIMRNHFEYGVESSPIFDILKILRIDIFNSNNITEINYFDYLYAITIVAFQHSAWDILKNNSDKEIDNWISYFKMEHSIKLLWPAQRLLITEGLLRGKDLVVPLPTGVGKTKCIELVLHNIFANKSSQIAVIIAPLRALCNEIASDLEPMFNESVIINQFSDVTQNDFIFELFQNKNYVFICTPEKFSYILRHDQDFLSKIQLFVLDEAHLFDDETRGTQYELLISHIEQNRNINTQIVLFSAVLSNANQIGEWLFDDSGKTIDYSKIKSTEKSIGFMSSDSIIHYFEKDDMNNESFFVPKSIDIKLLNKRPRERKDKYFPNLDSRDISIYFSNKLCPQGSVAIFAGKVSSIQSILKRINELQTHEYDLSNIINSSNCDEIRKLSNLFSIHYGDESELTKSAKIGVFAHYSRLPNGIKLSIEHALRKRYIVFVVCTTTLAEGVNIPLKYLFLMTISIGNSNIQIRKLQNLIGRTARSGIHTEGSAIITDTKFFDNRLNRTNGGIYRWNECKRMFEFENAEHCISSILSLVSNIDIDYEVYFDGVELYNYLMANYRNESCFTDLKLMITSRYEVYLNTNPNRFKKNKSNIDSKISSIEKTIESIENYICYIFSSNIELDFREIAKKVTTQTFAFHLANEDKKVMLISLVSLISENVISKMNTDNLNYLSKSMYGINKTSKILAWLNNNLSFLNEFSILDLLDEIIGLYYILSNNESNVSQNMFKYLVRSWLNGLTYNDMFNTLSDEIDLGKVEYICSNEISYNLSFLIGNIIDGLDYRLEHLNERLRLLQKMIKYGVSNSKQILIAENLFDERILIRKIERILNDSVIDEYTLRQQSIDKQEEIITLLNDYPDYFLYRFKLLIKANDTI